MVLRHVLVLASVMVIMLVILATTHPDTVPLGLLMGIFVLIYLVVFEGMVLVGIGLHRTGLLNWNQPRVRKVAAGVAALPTFLLVLQSIGQLTVRDMLLASGLCVLLYFYLGRLTASST